MAFKPMILRSHAKANSNPPPNATPSMTDIVGYGNNEIR